MIKISVCMIVKNEEKVLAKSLGCAKKFADEIIVVDTGSSDKTIEVARKFTENVYTFEWVNDFSKARNFSFSKASCDYVMWLDADDIIMDDDIVKLLEFKTRKNNADIYMLKYVTSHDENFKPIFSYYRERILKRSDNFMWVDPVHEVIVPRGAVKYLEINIFHNKVASAYTNRNLLIYQALVDKGVKLSPRQQFYYARELYYNNYLDEAIKEFSKFLIGGRGWIENNIEACLNLAKCYMAKGEKQNALTSLFGSFVMAKPKGEILYEIGNVFFELLRYDEAIYWYKLAKQSKNEIAKGGFVNQDCYDFLPNLQICVCYYKLNKKHLARRYHELSKKTKPAHPSVIHNEKFFNDEVKKAK